MGIKVYKFQKLEKKRNDFISCKIIPKFENKASNRPKIKKIMQINDNMSLSFLGKNKKCTSFMNRNCTPKFRSNSSNSVKIDKEMNPFLNNKLPALYSINTRYIREDYEDLEQINIIETPDDSLSSSKNTNFFSDMLPTLQKYIGNGFEERRTKIDYRKLHNIHERNPRFHPIISIS